MYTLHKAKEEIDAVAKHATDIAAHVLTLSDDLRAELVSFRKEILDGIDRKFADLERTIQGDTAVMDSSAVADLGAKVSLLSSVRSTSVAHGAGDHPETRAPVGEHEHPTEQNPYSGPAEDRPLQGGYNPNAEPQSEGHRY